MADVTNPEAIKFCNEVIRPLSEEARALKARVDDATVVWYGGLNTQFPNDTSAVIDNREAEGVSRLTGADINSVMAQLISQIGALNEQIIAKPCVRPLDAR